MIESMIFTGAKSPEYARDQAAAVAALNAWREQNPTAKLISIETVASDHPATMIDTGGYSFHGLRLWYETMVSA